MRSPRLVLLATNARDSCGSAERFSSGDLTLKCAPQPLMEIASGAISCRARSAQFARETLCQLSSSLPRGQGLMNNRLASTMSALTRNLHLGPAALVQQASGAAESFRKVKGKKRGEKRL
ncbi:hypothetical protein AAFF_G00388240 [Aldrovandia affinis]|uniref:Uncharacterized protein n=1 Tax=Aldrovandia affinis TaxID=143900 RepID=A0AAD7SF94_9TELE|nr:hypothetical protein AAFF_G00388240 [Aldrovandia affinis]